MPINFPDSPTVNQTFISGDKTWKWTGTRWEIVVVNPALLIDYYTSDQVDQVVLDLISSAPEALDTLNELAAALDDDANYAATVTTALGSKQDKVPGVSDTEISYLSNVTSDIQEQINNSGPASSSISSDITLAKGKYFVDTSIGRTLALPASPSLGDEVQIFDANGTAGANNIAVSNNGNKINGTLDSVLLDIDGVAAVFVWTGSTYGWRMG